MHTPESKERLVRFLINQLKDDHNDSAVCILHPQLCLICINTENLYLVCRLALNGYFICAMISNLKKKKKLEEK